MDMLGSWKGWVIFGIAFVLLTLAIMGFIRWRASRVPSEYERLGEGEGDYDIRKRRSTELDKDLTPGSPAEVEPPELWEVDDAFVPPNLPGTDV